MGATDGSTDADRVTVVGRLLGHAGEYGMVTRLSREAGVARQTLYAWRAQGRAALEQAFRPSAGGRAVDSALERQILTLLVEGHASERGIQRCLAEQGRAVSLGTISAVVAEAARRALAVMAAPLAIGPRIVALDELYGNDRRGAYLSVVDAHSGAVWQAAGPLDVDADTWTLLLWETQARGVRWTASIGDGGAALGQAALAVEPAGEHRRDVWHVLHACQQVQRRLDGWVAGLAARAATVARQAARVAAGGKPRGRRAESDPAAHRATVRRAQGIVDALAYLTGELRRLLGVVVPTPRGLLDSDARREELDTVLALLADLAATCPAAQQDQLALLRRQLRAALPALVSFAPPLDRVHRQWEPALGPGGLALLAWAWQRRAVLGPTADDLLAGLPPDWRPAARILLHAWDQAVRASSLVEAWHSVLRPHLAVHRTLCAGLLALLAVAYNHRVAARGVHAGASPLQRSGLTDAPADWLAVLGYPPLAPAALPIARRHHAQRRAA